MNTIHVTCSWHADTGKGSFSGCLRMGDSEQFVTGSSENTRPGRCLLQGVLECLRRTPEGSEVVVNLATEQRFKNGRPSGEHVDLKQAILDMVKARRLTMTWCFHPGMGDQIRAMASRQQVIRKIDSQSAFRSASPDRSLPFLPAQSGGFSAGDSIQWRKGNEWLSGIVEEVMATVVRICIVLPSGPEMMVNVNPKFLRLSNGAVNAR